MSLPLAYKNHDTNVNQDVIDSFKQFTLININNYNLIKEHLNDDKSENDKFPLTTSATIANATDRNTLNKAS